MSIVGCIVMGTFLLLDYYPFFFLLLAIVGVYGLLEKDTAIRSRIKAFGVAIGSGVIFSAPFWFPYAYSYFIGPHDPNYRVSYIALSHFDPTLYTVGLGYFGSLFWLGFYTLRSFATERSMKLLLIQFWLVTYWCLHHS